MAMYPCLSLPSLSFPTLTGSIVTFNSQYAGLPLKSHKVSIDSVSGVSSIEICATGRNIFPTISTFPYTAAGNVYFYDFAVNGTVRKIPTIHLKEGVEYTLSFDITNDNEPFNISVGAGSGAYSRDIKTVTGLSSGRVSVTFTPTASDLQAGDILAFRCPRYGTVQTFNFTIDNVQLEYGGLTDYQPFGTQTTIPIGQTAKAGTYNARTGLLLGDYDYIDLGSLTWGYTASGNRFTSSGIASVIKKPTTDSDTADVNCSIYTTMSLTDLRSSSSDNLIAVSDSGTISIRNTTYGTDANAFKTAMSGVYLKYAVASPTSLQLESCPIDVLAGVNNIWSDTGETTLQYPKFG